MRETRKMVGIARSCVLLGLAVVSLVIHTVQAQNCSDPTRRARLVVSDSSPAGRDTLWFGIHDSATAGIDLQFCEAEFPPFPPTGIFEARWTNPPGHEGMEPPANLGQGVKRDYRKHVSVAQIDTHRVKFQPTEPPGYPVKFRWLRAEVGAICDSCILVDEFDGLVVPRTRMTIQDSLVVNIPAIQSLLMIQYGARITGVEQSPDGMPGSFGLEQNYPNPFNPSTTIRFSIQRNSLTDVSIYNLLGQKVATLASDLLTPGYYTVRWNGTNSRGNSVASGVYFVRMNAEGDNGARFSVLRKLIFMK